jgi:hypothetical protein
MGYRIRIEQMDEAGIPAGSLQLIETESEAEAITIAVRAIESTGADGGGVATVSDGAGRMLLTYTGRAAP